MKFVSLLLIISAVLAAQTPKESISQPPSKLPVPAAREMTAADVEAFLDGIMPLQLKREDIAGAVIVIVKDGKPFFAKGYGYADVASGKPVTPDGTLFRPGSISKLFTWTSVMQQVEQGKLDLDRDVNDYLDFRIPATYPKPITLRNAMTHTPGFEEAIRDLIVGSDKNIPTLGDYLKTHMPARIFPPGTTPAYSNYATAMAGYIVQRVSGQPLEDYIEQHILQPLGMQHTTFRQPLPAALKPLMSSGYSVASKPSKPFEIVQAWPAGSASVTAADMTHFMIAHLQDGQYEGKQILRPETVRLMHSRQFAAVPGLNAMCLGFYEETRNGHRIIGHGGDTVYFHSDLHLVLDQNLGFFVSYNSGGKGAINPRGVVWEAFLDRYFPYTPPAAPEMSSAAADAQAVSGTYMSSRRPEKTILSVIGLVSEAKIAANADHTISTATFKDLNGEPKHFREIAPMMYRDEHGQDMVGFKRDENGRWVMGMDYPFMVLQQAPVLRGTGFNYTVLIFSIGVFALTVLLWPVGALVRRHYDRKLDLPAGASRRRTLIRIVCLIDLVFVVGWLYLVSTLSDLAKPTSGLDGKIHLIEIIGWLGVLGAVFAIYNLFRPGERWWWSRIHNIAIAVACVLFVWFIFTWHMLRWNTMY